MTWEKCKRAFRRLLDVASDISTIEGLPSRIRKLAALGVWVVGLLVGFGQWWLLLPSTWRIPAAIAVGLSAALLARLVLFLVVKAKALSSKSEGVSPDTGGTHLKDDWLDVWAGFGLGAAAPPGRPGHEDTALSVHVRIINRSTDRRAFVRFMLSDTEGQRQLRPAEMWQFKGRHFPYTDPPLNLRLLVEPIEVKAQEEVSGYIWFFARDRFTMPLDRFGMFDSISTEEAWTALPAAFRDAARDRTRSYCRAVTCTALGEVDIFDHEAVAPLLK